MRCTGHESLEFYPSTLALTSILALDKEHCLPAVSKSMILGAIEQNETHAQQVSTALQLFRPRLVSVRGPHASSKEIMALSSSSGNRSSTADSVSSSSSLDSLP